MPLELLRRARGVRSLDKMVMIGIIMTMSSRRWSIASAKAEFSAVVRRAARSPQVIENRGEPVAVVLSFDAYQRVAEHQGARERWSAFLDECANQDEGWDLDLPPRVARAAASDPLALKKSR